MALNFAFTFRVARAMVKSGLAQAKVYSSGSQDHSFVSLAETLSKDKASLGDEAESITPKAITTFIGGIITFSEQYCGRSTKKEERFMTRLPLRLLTDPSPTGSLAAALKVAYKEKAVNEWRKFDFGNATKAPLHKVMLKKIETELESGGWLKRPKFSFAPSIPSAEVGQLSTLAKDHGAVIVGSAAEATHIVHPDPYAGTTDSEDYLRTLEVQGNSAQVHWWYYPDSYNEWVPKNSVDNTIQPPFTALPKPIHVSSRFISDVAVFNEWGNEEDYELGPDGAPTADSSSSSPSKTTTASAPAPPPVEAATPAASTPAPAASAPPTATATTPGPAPTPTSVALTPASNAGSTPAAVPSSNAAQTPGSQPTPMDTSTTSTAVPATTSQPAAASTPAVSSTTVATPQAPTAMEGVETTAPAAAAPAATAAATTATTTAPTTTATTTAATPASTSTAPTIPVNGTSERKRPRASTSAPSEAPENKRAKRDAGNNPSAKELAALARDDNTFPVAGAYGAHHPGPGVKLQTAQAQGAAPITEATPKQLLNLSYAGRMATRVEEEPPVKTTDDTQVVARLAQYPVIVPAHSMWFDLESIAQIEEKSLPEFFDGQSESKTPTTYIYWRNFMVNTFRQNPGQYLSYTAVRRSQLGDAAAMLRVFNFLEHWGLINYNVDPTTRPLPMVPPTTTHYPKYVDTPRGLEPVVPSDLPTDAIGALYNPSGSAPGSSLPKHADAVAEANAKLFARGADVAPPRTLTDPSGNQATVVCTSCGAKCTSVYYACSRPGSFNVTLCAKCFHEGKYGTVLTEANFHRISVAAVNAAGAWTEEDTGKLLDAINEYGTDWRAVSEKVGKERQACLIHFLRLPIEEPFLTPGLIDPSKLPLHPPVGAGDENKSETANNLPTGFTWENSENPVMKMVTMLSRTVSPAVASAAAKAALETLEAETAKEEAALKKGPEEDTATDMDVDGKDKPEAGASPANPVEGAGVDPAADSGATNGADAAAEPAKPKEIPPGPLAGKVAAATALAAAAVKAKELAAFERSRVSALMADVLAAQLRKLEAKVRHFEVLEGYLERERAALLILRKNLQADRLTTQQVSTRESQLANAGYQQALSQLEEMCRRYGVTSGVGNMSGATAGAAARSGLGDGLGPSS